MKIFNKVEMCNLQKYCETYGRTPFTALDVHNLLIWGDEKRGIKPYHHTPSTNTVANRLTHARYIKRLGKQNSRQLYQYIGEISDREYLAAKPKFRTCVICGERVWQSRNGHNKYCSNNCKRKGRNAYQRTWFKAKLARLKAEGICPCCGQVIKSS